MSAEFTPDPRPATEPPVPRYTTSPETRPMRSLAGIRGVYGAVLLAAFVLVIVGGIVATVWSLQSMNANRNTLVGVTALIIGVVTIFAGVLVWQGRHEMGGVFAIVCGILFLVLGPANAGIFAVLGGILAVIANRVADIVA